MWIPELQLSSSDGEILLNSTAWLTDPIIKKSAVKTTEEVHVYSKCRKPELPGEQVIECTS